MPVFPTIDQPGRVRANDRTDADGSNNDHSVDVTAQPARTDSVQPRIIALLNQKGGVGKTTTAVNLAAGLARAGQRVLTIDLDPQAHLTLSLGLDTDQLHKSAYDLLTDRNVSALELVEQVHLDSSSSTPHAPENTAGDYHDEPVTESNGQADDSTSEPPQAQSNDAGQTASTSIAILPAEVNLAGVESELAEMLATGSAQTVLRNKTRQLIQQFDTVLIDCPPSLGLLTINGLSLAHEVIVPMQAHFLALQGLSKLFDTVRMVSEGINPALSIAGIVLCMYEGNTILAAEVQRDLQQFLENARGQNVPWQHAQVYQPPIRRNIKLAECPSFGQSIFDYAPASRGAADYGKLVHSIIQTPAH